MDEYGAPPQERIFLSGAKTRRDLRLSVAVTIAGALLYGVSITVRTGFAFSDFSLLFFFVILGDVGDTLLFIGLIFTGINWWLLRRRESGPDSTRGEGMVVTAKALPAPPASSTSGAARTRVACANCGSVWPAGQSSRCPKCQATLPSAGV